MAALVFEIEDTNRHWSLETPSEECEWKQGDSADAERPALKFCSGRACPAFRFQPHPLRLDK
jgi:hypothetical protein